MASLFWSNLKTAVRPIPRDSPSASSRQQSSSRPTMDSRRPSARGPSQSRRSHHFDADSDSDDRATRRGKSTSSRTKARPVHRRTDSGYADGSRPIPASYGSSSSPLASARHDSMLSESRGRRSGRALGAGATAAVSRTRPTRSSGQSADDAASMRELQMERRDSVHRRRASLAGLGLSAPPSPTGSGSGYEANSPSSSSSKTLRYSGNGGRHSPPSAYAPRRDYSTERTRSKSHARRRRGASDASDEYGMDPRASYGKGFGSRRLSVSDAAAATGRGPARGIYGEGSRADYVSDGRGRRRTSGRA